MKKSFAILASLALIALQSGTARAAQYEVYVTGATRVSHQQQELSTLVQKGILVDTTLKTLKLQLSATCKINELCPESIHAVTLNLVDVKSARGVPVALTARGNLTLNGVDSATEVTLQLNADNAMDIQINNNFGCKSNVSQFVGSPAVRPTILF